MQFESDRHHPRPAADARAGIAGTSGPRGGRGAGVAAWPGGERPQRRERDHWDTVALGMPDLLPAASTQYYRRRELALIERALGPLRGRRVLKLDLWNEAVNTRVLPWMAERGATCVGIDLSPVTVGRARDNLREGQPGVRVLQADMRRLPFPDASFDLAYTMGTIEHIDDVRSPLDELHRVLRPGGRALVGVPHRWDPFLRPVLVRVLEAFGKYPYSPERSFGAGELAELCEACGFRVVERTGLLGSPGIIRMADIFFFRRGVNLGPLTRLALAPFEGAEARWAWARRLGYLLVLAVEKPFGRG